MGKNKMIATAAIGVYLVLICAASVFSIDIPAKLKDIPLFEGSKVQHAMDTGNAAMLGATVKTKAAAVADFYKKVMKDKGWKSIFQMQSEDGQVIHYQKGSEICQINFQEDDEGTTYNIVISSN